MCPEPQILSLYLDGELPSPWKEKMQEHFEQCIVCREKFENMKRLQELFHKDKTAARTYIERIVDAPGTQKGSNSQEKTSAENDLKEVKERVWNKIENRRNFRSQNINMWQRRLSIPVPAAAAAAVIILLLAAFWMRINTNAPNQQDTTDKSNFILAAEMDKIEEIPGIIPSAADMSGILQYLAPANNGTNIIILQLPESQNFLRAGEPAIIRAADFSRQDSRRQP